MALPQDNAELRNDDTTVATEERASSSSSEAAAATAMPSSAEKAHELQAAEGAATPPPMQQMDRDWSSSSDDDEVVDTSRIPAEVFERDPAGGNKDWSMMSTDSVFGLQVAPSSDFTGFFLAHPELMDISTPPRSSMVNVDADASANANANADAAVVAPPFESIPELSGASMKGNYSFAFPNLIEDKRPSSSPSPRKVQDEPPATAATTEAAPQDEPTPEQAEAQASTKQEAAPDNEPAKGGLFACFPCCS